MRSPPAVGASVALFKDSRLALSDRSMLLTLYLSLIAFVLTASFVTQAFVPGWGAAGTTWGLAPGW
jgi:hypothetical protein